MLPLKISHICFVLSLCLYSLAQSYPNVNFLGQTLANHSYVNLGLVGSSMSNSVQCHTDLHTCCTAMQGSHRGDWYFPNGSRLSFSGSGDIHQVRDDRRVDLHRRHENKSGIYRCDIPTLAVHDDDTSVQDTVYVGLYHSGG